MINFNGELVETEKADLDIHNRGFMYGDAVFETIKLSNGKLLFWEDHYFRLMASMRIMRMEIPMNFTPEFLENEIVKTLLVDGSKINNARIKLIVSRSGQGYYLPLERKVNYYILADKIDRDVYFFNTEHYEVELYKDNFLSPSILSTLKTNNRAINILGSIFASENNYQNCLLLNTEKHVVEALNANIFLVKGDKVKTPPLTDGCLKGVMRKQIVEIISENENLTFEEASISPFELQKADELFLTNVIIGIQPITKYRKKYFNTTLAKVLIEELNTRIKN